MRKLVILAVVSVAACSQLQSALTEVDKLCQVASPLATLATAIPIYGPGVAAGVSVGCDTVSGLTKLNSDPTSAAWLAKQIELLKTALGQG